MNQDLFDAPAHWAIAPGVTRLRGFALATEQALLDGVAAVVAEAPLRHMFTPGGLKMAVALTNCGLVLPYVTAEDPEVAMGAGMFAAMLALGIWGLWPLGALLVALPLAVQHPFFDSRLTNWVGLVTQKPVTEDWVPLLPWLGVMLWGLALGQWLLARRRPLLAGPLLPALAPLATLGRWPLTIYMLHQPLLIGALTGWQMLAR